jgi:hypothetical protein
MDIPSISFDVHHRYTPEVRDLIGQKLRAAMAVLDDRTYRLLTPGHLRRLAEIASTTAPVVSLYLQLRPKRRVGRVWQPFLFQSQDRDIATLSHPSRARGHKRRIRPHRGGVDRGAPRHGSRGCVLRLPVARSLASNRPLHSFARRRSAVASAIHTPARADAGRAGPLRARPAIARGEPILH